MLVTNEQFKEYAKQGYNRIPVMQEFLSDLETPLSIYLKLANTPYTFLLESMQGGEKWGRYSYIGLPCQQRISVTNDRIKLVNNNNIQEIQHDDPLNWIENYFHQFKAVPLPQMKRFLGGLVGYFGYDTIRYIEPRLTSFQQVDKLNIPDIMLLLSDEIIIYDNLNNKITVIIYVDPAVENGYQNALEKINQYHQKIINTKLQSKPLSKSELTSTEFQSNISRVDYEKKVKKVLNYFIEGDAMQLILSQRFHKSFNAQAINLYRSLRFLNPSPYMFYFNLEDFYVVGASPEILVRLQDEQVTLRPLAGTRPRGKNEQEDLRLEQELLADPKELSEHLMLIDLGRNDVGRVSEVGSVKLTEQMVIERYSHVMHISSNVVGKLRPNLTALDVLRATFPAGTVSGAPKVHAMEIIAQLEEEKRAIYGGAVGYLSWNGDMDMALALRMAIIKNNMVNVQTGAGLVVDSVPENEWLECVNKARGVFRAVEMAENELDEYGI